MLRVHTTCKRINYKTDLHNQASFAGLCHGAAGANLICALAPKLSAFFVCFEFNLFTSATHARQRLVPGLFSFCLVPEILIVLYCIVAEERGQLSSDSAEKIIRFRSD